MLMSTPDRAPERSYLDYKDKIKRKLDAFDYYQTVLISRRAEEVRFWRRYFADPKLVDTRTEDEKKWRSLVMLPYGYSGIQSLVAHLVDMLMSPSPVLTVSGRGAEDKRASSNERLVNYTFGTLNRLGAFAEEAFTRGCVQGMDVWKLSWRDEWTPHQFNPSPIDEMRFKEAVEQGEQATGTEAPLEPHPITGNVDMAAWGRWCALVAEAGLSIPTIPVAGTRKVRSFVGPWLRSVELYDLAYDPKMPDFQRQHCIYHRALIPRAELLKMAERDPERYDGKAIQDLPQSVGWGGTGKTVAEQQHDILDALGIAEAPNDQDPYYNDAVEVIEFSSPQDEECSWGIIGNHDRLITKRPEDYPYATRRQPWVAYYNVPTPGAAVGISEYQQNGQLHEVADQMLMAVADYARLQTMPVLKHTSGLGLGGPLASPKPGDIIDLEPEETLEQAFDFSKPLSVGVETIGFCKREIDETTGIFSSVRGAPAEVARVSATEAQGRSTASLARVKARLYRFADALAQGPIPMSFGLWRQFGEPDMLENIAGLDPMTALADDSLLLGLEQDYVTAASAVSADKNMQVKQLQDTVGGLQQLGLLQPGGRAAVAAAKALVVVTGTPNGQELLQAIEADMQAAQQAQAQQPPQAGAPPAAPGEEGAPAAPGEEQPAPAPGPAEEVPA